MDYMYKIEGKMKRDLYLNIFQDELVKIIKWYYFNSFCIIFEYDNVPQHIAKSIKQWLSM